MHITPPVGQHENLLSDSVRDRLNALYAKVPGVSCSQCDRPGKCCELTKAEWVADYATMYPLYAVEYLNIVDYVRTHFDSERQRELLEIVDERPKRCPFLTKQGGCSIHPARPLTCRTYGVLNRAEQVEAAIRQDVPRYWTSAFLATERYTVCGQTRLQEPEKLQAHLDAMVTFDYERQMLAMGKEVGLGDEARQVAFEAATGKELPIRWTWGGFNVLLQTSLAWVEKHFEAFWKKSFLGE